MTRAADAPRPPVRPRESWRPAPKVRPCLVCNKPRISAGPGDRLHDKCRGDGPNDGEAAALVIDGRKAGSA